MWGAMCRVDGHRKMTPCRCDHSPYSDIVSIAERGLGEVFVALADSLREEHDVIDTMDYLVEASTKFTSASEAGIVLADTKGTLHVVASTSERAADVEEEQLGAHEGPCWEAFRTGVLVEVPAIPATADRWPRFAHATQTRGFEAAHAIPLRLRNQTLGSLNLFSTRIGRLTDADASLAQAFADVATIGIIQLSTIQEGADLNKQLQSALATRIIIEQAKGIISTQHDVPIDTAFAVLRTYARRTGTHLHDVATQVTTNHLHL
jgi:transcriptional regulator with GAF, ATPase, and Fis domain